MKGDAIKLVAFLEGSQKRFIIPVYQRNYDWKKENCKQLYDDLVAVIKEKKPCHFFGSVVSYCHNKDVIIIDGQQRITTVSLILIAMINAIDAGVMTAEDDQLRDKLKETYIIDRFSKKERKVRLKPFRDDCDAFDNLIFKSPDNYIESSNVTINYRYFYDRLVNGKELTLDELNTAIESLEVIDILIEPEHGDDPQLIFESLNSTGLDLTEADKIRNFVLMGQSDETQEEYYNKYWSKIEKNCGSAIDGFVRDYLTVKTGLIPMLKKIYASFKTYVAKDKIEQTLMDMTKYSNYYHQIKESDLGDKNLNEIAQRLNLLDVTVAYPYFMAFLDYAAETMMGLEEKTKVLSTIEIFVFRRQLCDLPSNALNKIFASLHSQIMKQLKDGINYSSVLIYVLQSRTMSSAFPRDEEFIQTFATRNIYSMHKKNRYYIFERLENSSSKEKNDVIENLESKTLTIEHIMPQTLSNEWKLALGDDYERIHEEWLHTIANLTLSGYNPNYSNKSFKEKKEMENGFNQSGLRLNHYIAQFNDWTEAEMKMRKDHLVKLALQIWPFPITDYKPAEKDEECIPLSEDYRYTDRYIKSFIFLETKYSAESWAAALETIFRLLYTLEPSILFAEANNPSNVWLKSVPFEYGNKKIADGLYLCTYSDTTSKIRLLRNTFSKYSLDEDELSFILWPPKQKTDK